MLRQGQRVILNVDAATRATRPRLGSEVDMGTPGFGGVPDVPTQSRASDPPGEKMPATTDNQKLTAWVEHWAGIRSEEHTPELQSLMRISHAVFCLNKKTTSCNQDSYN